MIDTNKTRAVIFDIDGTIVDSFRTYRKVFNEGIAAYGMEPVSESLLDGCLRRGMGLRAILERIFPDGTEEAVYDACRDRIKYLYRRIEGEEVRSYPGIDELFTGLRDRGIRIGIATGRMSTPEDEWERFRRLGLNHFLGTIVTSHEIARRKPAPDVIIECARRLGLPTSACIAVGDTGNDIIAAKSAGAIAVFVRTGNEDEEVLMKAGPDFILESTSGLLGLLA
jgi:HAD superfamily hydrolase (TIGR01509 family)